MLHHDRDIGFEHAGVIRFARHLFRLFQVVEAQVQRAPRGHGHAIRTDRFAIAEIKRDLHVRIDVVGVEQARGLVAFEARVVIVVAGRGNVLLPQAINGRVLLEKARDTGRGLVLNPTDDTASVPFPPEAMAQFLAMLG